MAEQNDIVRVELKSGETLITRVVDVKGGWTTVIGDEGQQMKVRNGQVKGPASDEEIKQMESEQSKSEKTIKFDLSRYVKSDVKTPSGRKAVDSGDEVAQALRGCDLDEVYAMAAYVLDTPEEQLRERYSHLNAGMQRMTLGNRIRAAHEKETE